jgi:cyclohexadieny/prephenate dehydrogenase
MRLGILGLGLIGASLAKAVRPSQLYSEIVGYGHRQTTVQAALEQGIIDRAVSSAAELVYQCDLVLIATPTLLAEQQLVELIGHANQLERPPVLTDAASVKGNLWRAIDALGLAQWPSFVVLGHPIAGSEKSGVHAARADLFDRHRVILTPQSSTDPTAIAVVTDLWEAAGAEVLSMSVQLHDQVLAATSHLPHMLAYALVETLATSDLADDIFQFAAGGFRDFTRIASSDPVMWRDIALANRTELLQALDQFSAGVQRLRTAIEAEDTSTITAIFERAKGSRDDLLSTLDRSS